MDAFALLVEEPLEDRRAGDGLDDFVDHATGIIRCNGGVAEFEGKVAGLAVVGLSGGVVGAASVDAPGADAQGREAGDGTFVVSCYLAFEYFISISAPTLRLARTGIRSRFLLACRGMMESMMPLLLFLGSLVTRNAFSVFRICVNAWHTGWNFSIHTFSYCNISILSQSAFKCIIVEKNSQNDKLKLYKNLERVSYFFNYYIFIL